MQGGRQAGRVGGDTLPGQGRLSGVCCGCELINTPPSPPPPPAAAAAALLQIFMFPRRSPVRIFLSPCQRALTLCFNTQPFLKYSYVFRQRIYSIILLGNTIVFPRTQNILVFYTTLKYFFILDNLKYSFILHDLKSSFTLHDPKISLFLLDHSKHLCLLAPLKLGLPFTCHVSKQKSRPSLTTLNIPALFMPTNQIQIENISFQSPRL